jgi:tetrapyrrole methylase family protein/MazG family protein
MPKAPTNTRDFSALVEVVEALRGPDGCPWDKEQSHKTLTQYAIEEAHELAEAIDSGSREHTIEELGDLLLQVILHAEIGRQETDKQKHFTLNDVIQGISEKMIRRHPHVFGDVKVSGSGEVLDNWAKIKEQEKEQSPFASIPDSLPALVRAQKIGNKTVRFNFDWENPWQVIEKVEEELGELKEAMREKSQEEQQKELGDLLFSITQVARHLNFDSEQALRMTNKKFEKRFMKMRELVTLDGHDLSKLQVQELEKYWQKAKKHD